MKGIIIAGVMAAGLSLAACSSQPTHAKLMPATHTAAPVVTQPATPTAQEVAQTAVGGKVTSGQYTEYVVRSVRPIGLVSSDGSGDYSVPVYMDFRYNTNAGYGGGPNPGVPANWVDAGQLNGTAALYANGSSSFTIAP